MSSPAGETSEADSSAAGATSDGAPRCPICRGVASVRHRHTVEAVAAAHTPPARDADRHRRMLVEIHRLWPAGFVDACTCDACQLGFARPMVAGDAAFFELLHERAGYPRERWEFARTREQFATADGRVLDIGAGRGDFLASLPASLEKHAVEASPSLCAELGRRGIRAHADLAAAAAAGPFALVTMFHVIQYFADPVAALARCGRMLASDGRLLISIPNAAAGGAIDVLPAPPHPLTRWTRPAIERAVAAAGLTVERFEWIPQPLSSLLWAANARTRERAIARPTSLSGRIDAMPRGRLRTVLLASLATLWLPRIALSARDRLHHSQCFIVARRPNADHMSSS